ncbi:MULTISPECIES: hypothetical protein [Pelosinus]|jgi:hypothetical protein|uniref:Uncharacterized protein n=1 Tax=Pelosinus fermentans B4 TaxID=1149862 RepID=I9LC70_9FIRM|nr:MULTISPECIES: hypothetical protein [Pelosinus]EIW17921.1 hypothetical protein FB4_3964 [Pelosinus fermentans B4]EIW23883.1 hypothetical protein FA11_3966 [Pelosinus fermentans A11]OAM94806.1 hypothetical protein FR7_02826 [Pelosinus fermentans DSM 17108]SDR18032.1 hypothetical protein SAMN04515679_2953 [Pelosinus fermentans]
MSVEYDFEEAVEMLEAFNRAGISYRICEDGTFSFNSDNDRERAKKVIEELKKKA